MLCRIIRWVPYEWLRVNDEPGLAFCLKDVSRVKIGGQENVRGRSARKLSEETQTFVDDSWVWPSLFFLDGFGTPMRDQARQRTERMRVTWQWSASPS